MNANLQTATKELTQLTSDKAYSKFTLQDEHTHYKYSATTQYSKNLQHFTVSCQCLHSKYHNIKLWSTSITGSISWTTGRAYSP